MKSFIEKAINNYAFSLSDGGFFDYVFTETFNDETIRDTQLTEVPDRSGINFSKEENAIVNAANGSLSLNASLSFKVPLTARIIATNTSTDIAGLENDLPLALNSDPWDGWRVSIDSENPITSSIEYSPFTGAQFKIELTPPNPALCSNLILTPFSDLPVDILRVQIFQSLDQSLSEAFEPISIQEQTNIILDKPTNIDFPLQTVGKIIILINQPIYKRGSLQSNQSETMHRKIYDSVKDIRRQDLKTIPYKNNKKALIRVFNNALSNTKNPNKQFFKVQIPQLNFQPSYGPLTLERIMDVNKTEKNNDKIWVHNSKLNEFIRRMIHERIFSDNYQILNDRYLYNIKNIVSQQKSTLDKVLISNNNQEFPRIEALEPEFDANVHAADAMNDSNVLKYTYDIGLRNIELGSGLKIYRGVYVSKSIPVPGNSIEVKIKPEEFNYKYLSSPRDSKFITSIEYSISNRSDPKLETDWVPILPSGESKVNAERLFLNPAGETSFRFLASRESELMVYKNGYQLPLDEFFTTASTNSNSIKGVRIPLGAYASSDVFTADYTTYNNDSIINLVDKGFYQTTLASAFDRNGSGESFSFTPPDRVITLSQQPFIDYDKVNQSGSYSLQYGFQGSYQPITVQLEDGTIALNQTNYLGTSQNNLNSFDESYTAYIQSGNNVIFNRDITQKFTVYYQYLPSNLKFRIIMRVNDMTHISPLVSTLQIKTKVKKSDVRSPF